MLTVKRHTFVGDSENNQMNRDSMNQGNFLPFSKLEEPVGAQTLSANTEFVE